MENKELKIEYLPIDKLNPYENNARKHTDVDLNTIENSIKEFGFKDPIGVWGKNNTIVEGHGRLIAAQRIGLKTVPVIRLDDLTDEQRRDYALAHNKTAEMSEWDDYILDTELSKIFDIDMEDFGFLDDSLSFSEDDLDSDEEKLNVSVTINCGSADNYDKIKERLQELADEIEATISIKMI